MKGEVLSKIVQKMHFITSKNDMLTKKLLFIALSVNVHNNLVSKVEYHGGSFHFFLQNEQADEQFLLVYFLTQRSI